MKDNLFTPDAPGKLKRLLDEIDICIFTTSDYLVRKSESPKDGKKERPNFPFGLFMGFFLRV
jgi:hypothetical protein